MADLHHLGRRRGPAARRRAARPVRPGRGGHEDRRHLLRRHAAPARPRDDPGRRPAHHLPRRADHRPGPAQPPHHVADHPRPRRPAASRSSSPRSTWRRPTSSPTGSRCSTTAGWSPRAPPTSSSGSIPGGHIRLRFADAARARIGRPRRSATVDPRRRRAHPAGPERRRRPVAAGAARPARRRRRSRSTSCRSTPPTSTTSSSPSPATPTKRRSQSDEHPVLRRDRLGDDAAPQAPAHAALPVHDPDARRHAGRLPAAVRLRLRRHARRRARRRGPAAGPSTSTTSSPASC